MDQITNPKFRKTHPVLMRNTHMEPEPAEPRLYIRLNGDMVEGPFGADLIRLMVRRKGLSILTPVCLEGTDSWITFKELPQPNMPIRAGRLRKLFLSWIQIEPLPSSPSS